MVDDNIVLGEEDIKAMKENGYIFIDTPTGFYTLETEDHFEQWSKGKGEPVPLEPQPDDYVAKR